MRSRSKLAPVFVLLFGAIAACGPAPPPLEDCTIVGTEGDNTLVGTEGPDAICGLGGDDLIVGLGGNDVLSGGPGTDTLNPGDGDDIVWGEDGSDSVNRRRPGTISTLPVDGFGDDVAYLGQGNDSALMGDGDDVVYTGPRGDEPLPSEDVNGEAGNDDLFLEGDEGGGWMNGGPGNDYIEGHAVQGTAITMFGGAGNDVMFSVSPVVQVNAQGNDGNDLAVLFDGGLDGFAPDDDPSPSLPVAGCNIIFGDDIGLQCERLGNIEFSINTDSGDVTLGAELDALSAELIAVRDSGDLSGEACYCDPNLLPAYPFPYDVVLD